MVETRFSTGVPAAEDNPFWHHFWNNKMAAMGRNGIFVYRRPLRYRKKSVQLPGIGAHTFLAAEEKGIDVRIAFDIIRLATRGSYDVDLI